MNYFSIIQTTCAIAGLCLLMAGQIHLKGLLRSQMYGK